MKASGFEPETYGLKVRGTVDASADSAKSCDDKPKPLAYSLAPNLEKPVNSSPLDCAKIDPDLARLVNLWADLPEAVRKLLVTTAETLAGHCH
jgi:hypothetical protein